MLDRYEHVLLREQARYTPGSAAVTSLHADLAPARASFTTAAEQRKNVLPPNPNWVQKRCCGRSLPLPPPSAAWPRAALRSARRRTCTAPRLRQLPRRRPRRIQSSQIPRACWRPTSPTASATSPTPGQVRDDHELVFKLDILVTQTKSHLGIEPGSIWALIITDHQAPTLDEIALQTMLAVLGVALGIASGGSAVAAVAALGLSSFMALQTYEDYALRSDAYGAQLLSEEPWMGWVVLAIVGVVADFAGWIRDPPIRPRCARSRRPATSPRWRTAGRGRGADPEQHPRACRAGATSAQRVGLDLGRRRACRRDARQHRARPARRADRQGRLLHPAQPAPRYRHVHEVAATKQAADLIGDINQLSPAQIAQVRALYSQAIENTQRIASQGRQLGLTLDEVDAVVQNWARRGTGTIDDVLSEMTAARAARPAGEAGAWTPPSGWNGPSKYGRWEGARGNSGWIDERPEVIRIVGRPLAARPTRSRSGKARWTSARGPEVSFGFRDWSASMPTTWRRSGWPSPSGKVSCLRDPGRNAFRRRSTGSAMHLTASAVRVSGAPRRRRRGPARPQGPAQGAAYGPGNL